MGPMQLNLNNLLQQQFSSENWAQNWLRTFPTTNFSRKLSPILAARTGLKANPRIDLDLALKEIPSATTISIAGVE